jgi:hypothetical protein
VEVQPWCSAALIDRYTAVTAMHCAVASHRKWAQVLGSESYAQMQEWHLRQSELEHEGNATFFIPRLNTDPQAEWIVSLVIVYGCSDLLSATCKRVRVHDISIANEAMRYRDHGPNAPVTAVGVDVAALHVRHVYSTDFGFENVQTFPSVRPFLFRVETFEYVGNDTKWLEFFGIFTSSPNMLFSIFHAQDSRVRQFGYGWYDDTQTSARILRLAEIDYDFDFYSGKLPPFPAREDMVLVSDLQNVAFPDVCLKGRGKHVDRPGDSGGGILAAGTDEIFGVLQGAHCFTNMAVYWERLMQPYATWTTGVCRMSDFLFCKPW